MSARSRYKIHRQSTESMVLVVDNKPIAVYTYATRWPYFLTILLADGRRFLSWHRAYLRTFRFLLFSLLLCHCRWLIGWSHYHHYHLHLTAREDDGDDAVDAHKFSSQFNILFATVYLFIIIFVLVSFRRMIAIKLKKKNEVVAANDSRPDGCVLVGRDSLNTWKMWTIN